MAIIFACFASSQINQVFIDQLNPFSLALELGNARETFASLISDVDMRISITAVIGFLGYLFWPAVLLASTVSSRPIPTYLASFGVVSLVTVPMALYLGKHNLLFAVSAYFTAFVLLGFVCILVYSGRAIVRKVRNA